MPGTNRPIGRTRRDIDAFDAAAANREMAHTLQRNTLKRKARAKGLELRHSSYGYSLVDSSRARVDDRNDLTLDEVEARLAVYEK
ncbi:MAG: hypothetical protein ABUS54_00505 [Actinomycetota bacterium]